MTSAATVKPRSCLSPAPTQDAQAPKPDAAPPREPQESAAAQARSSSRARTPPAKHAQRGPSRSTGPRPRAPDAQQQIPTRPQTMPRPARTAPSTLGPPCPPGCAWSPTREPVQQAPTCHPALASRVRQGSSRRLRGLPAARLAQEIQGVWLDPLSVPPTQATVSPWMAHLVVVAHPTEISSLVPIASTSDSLLGQAPSPSLGE